MPVNPDLILAETELFVCQTCAAWETHWSLWRELEAQGTGLRQHDNWCSAVVALSVLLQAGPTGSALRWFLRPAPRRTPHRPTLGPSAMAWCEGREFGAHARALVVDIKPAMAGRGPPLVHWHVHPENRARHAVLPPPTLISRGSTADLLLRRAGRPLPR